MKKNKLDQVQQLLKKNKLQEAKRLCKSVCRKRKTDIDAWVLLGVINSQLQDYKEAAECFEHVVRVQPKHAGAYTYLGKCQEMLGDWEGAEKSYASAGKLTPQSQVFNNLGAVKTHLKKLDEAEQCFLQAIEMHSDSLSAHNNLGALYVSQNRWQEAETIFKSSLKIKNDNMVALNFLADIFTKVQRFEEAEKTYLQMISFQPNNPALEASLGRFYYSIQSFDKAKQTLETVLENHPNFFPALTELGNIMLFTGDLEKARDYFMQSLAFNSNEVVTLNNLGIALTELGEFEQAKTYLQRALQIEPNRKDTSLNLSQALSLLGELEAATNLLSNALACNPDNVEIETKLAAGLLAQGKFTEAYQQYQSATEKAQDKGVIKFMNAALPPMNYTNLYSREGLFAAHTTWGRKVESLYPQQSHFKNVPDASKKLRIGYVSPDFRNHSVSYFFEPIIANHDKDKFEVYCYSVSNKQDAKTTQFKAYADVWRECGNTSDDELESLVRNDQLDVLVDLSGHTQGNRLTLFAKRVAPVQVSYLGYPNTTGLTRMDYLISDENCDPTETADAFYSESLIRIAPAFFCYQIPDSAPEVATLPALENGYITFASFNNLVKIGEEVIVLWSDVLKAVPDSKLLMQSASFRDQSTRKRIEQQFHALGVAVDRLVLKPYTDLSDYLAEHNKVDIILDSFPWAGHTITCHALYMGVPVITLVGERHASRMGYSAMRNLGLDECIALSKDEFVEKAVGLATNLPWLEELRTQLRPALVSSALCDAAQFTQKLEQQYQFMWQTWCESAVNNEQRA